MTLLITLGQESAIHQSSDYRLSDRGVLKDNAQGVKQLSISTLCWHSQISFTGIAHDGHGYSTRTWLEEEGARAVNLDQTPEDFVHGVAERGTRELERVTGYDRSLTIVVSVTASHRCRLFCLSNFEGRKTGALLDTLVESELELSSPDVWVHGINLPRPIWRRLKRSLIGLKGGETEAAAKALRDQIAAANREAALLYPKLISQGCWVSSLFANGIGYGGNYGDVTGRLSQISRGSELINDLLGQHPGVGPLRQSVTFGTFADALDESRQSLKPGSD